MAARAERDGVQSFRPSFPAVTSTVQASMLTGLDVAEHGVVGNGWYGRESGEVRFWRQSNRMVLGRKVWEVLRDRAGEATCANLFWWFNMHSSADWSITPRPLYPANGRKVFDVHTQPMGMREEVKRALGDFPFPAFWGPAAGIASSRWIAGAAKWIEKRERPTMQLVYLPHLDYGLQKFGPEAAESGAELKAIDEVAGDLADELEAGGVKVLIVSEYGISEVARPVHLNRVFRERGWLAIKDELGRDALIPGDSMVFAVADHQMAHVYVRDPELLGEVKRAIQGAAGVAEVRPGVEMWGEGTAAARRGGDLVAVAEPDAWFTYYFWENDDRAPDFARCVDIHRKPGYDPVELFIDPGVRSPKLAVARHLAKVRLGMRSLLEIIPLDASLVRGSHGRDDAPEAGQPVVIGAGREVKRAEDVFGAILGAAGNPGNPG